MHEVKVRAESPLHDTHQSLNEVVCSRSVLWKQDHVLQILVVLTNCKHMPLPFKHWLTESYPLCCHPLNSVRILSAMRSPDSRIFYVALHALGSRHFLTLIFKHYKKGFQ